MVNSFHLLEVCLLSWLGGGSEGCVSTRRPTMSDDEMPKQLIFISYIQKVISEQSHSDFLRIFCYVSDFSYISVECDCCFSMEMLCIARI